MTKDFKRFFVSAAILLVAVVVVSEAFFLYAFETFDFPLRIISILFVCVATCATHIWVMRTVVENPKSFNMVFLLQTALKLLLYLVFVAVYLYIFTEHGIPFTLHFFVVYLFFGIFEVSMILKFIKEKSVKTSDNVEKSI